MNTNIIELSYWFTKNKLTKIFKVDNYSWKLLCIIDFNICNFNIKIIKFDKKYKFLKSFIKITRTCVLHDKNYIYIYDISKIDLVEHLHVQAMCVKIPDEMILFTTSKKLTVNHNRLKILPKNIDNLINLTMITVAVNNIVILPKNICNLINLEYLVVSYNQISVIPKNIGRLINLVHLEIANNKIKIIPKNMGNLIKLKFLNINTNPLEFIDNKLKNLVELKKIRLSNGQFELLPKKLQNLIDIKKIKLNN
jgi:Leucine-rich repeat (LRR) protein